VTAATTTTTSTRRGGAWKWLLPLVAAVGLTVLVLPSGGDATPYDLDSPAPEGYRGLRLMLEAFGVTVDAVDASDVGADLAADHDLVFVPQGDAVDEPMAERLFRFGDAGGRIVLGAPSPWIGPAGVSDEDGFVEPFGGTDVCTLGDLDAAGGLDESFFASPVEVGYGDDSCYGDDATALVVRSYGERSEITTIASPELFTNELMGAPAPEEPVGPIPANAFVAQRLLGADDRGNPTRVAVVTSGLGPAVGGGEKSFMDYMSPGVKLGLLELGAAVLFYAIAKGRRHGRIVTEPEPVTIAGSAFVEAVGSLLERQGDVARAAEVVRSGHCRDLGRRLGQGTGNDRAALAATVAARTGRDPAAVMALLSSPIDTETDLVTMTRELDSLRQEALHV